MSPSSMQEWGLLGVLYDSKLRTLSLVRYHDFLLGFTPHVRALLLVCSKNVLLFLAPLTTKLEFLWWSQSKKNYNGSD